jgi:hypothetical protein
MNFYKNSHNNLNLLYNFDNENHPYLTFDVENPPNLIFDIENPINYEHINFIKNYYLSNNTVHNNYNYNIKEKIIRIIYEKINNFIKKN